MPDAPISIFISYSRTDSDFVDRLEADLQARDFKTWVDRRRLEGGQDWMDSIQQALERSDVLVLVLSPDAVDSRFVRMEYREAILVGKLVVPLEHRKCDKVPMELNGIQWINFTGGTRYEPGLRDLLVALASVVKVPQPAARADARVQMAPEPPATAEPDLVVARPAPAPPDANLNDLYRAGVKARAEGNLDRAAILWQQVLDRDPKFGGGSLATQMRQLDQELLPLRVERLRERAERAEREGEWGQAIGAWEALSRLDPKQPTARDRQRVAEQNQKCAWRYENVRQFVADGDIKSAKLELQTLWGEAPYYRDPAGLAPKVGLKVPAPYEVQTERDRRNQQAQATRDRRSQQAQAARDQRRRFVQGWRG